MLPKLMLLLSAVQVMFVPQYKSETYLSVEEDVLPNGLEYILKRSSGKHLIEIPQDRIKQEIDSKERRASSSTSGSSFIRFGRDGHGQPHARSDTIIRYGRGGDPSVFDYRLSRLRQERLRKLARLCAAANNRDFPIDPTSAEEKVIRDICYDSPLHPTSPDFV